MPELDSPNQENLLGYTLPTSGSPASPSPTGTIPDTLTDPASTPPSAEESAPADPFDRLGDLLGTLGRGGGGVSIPPSPQGGTTVAYSPATQSKTPAAAVVVLLGALGFGAWYWYKKKGGG